jgi:hypothetical protein
MTPELAIHKVLTEIDQEIAELQVKLEGYRDTDAADVNWGHVGDLGRIKMLLREANGKEG